jgi:hypothetical protein
MRSDLRSFSQLHVPARLGSAAAAAAVCFLFSATASLLAAPGAATRPTTSPSGDDFDPIVSFVDFRGVTLEEAVDQLRDITRVNIVVRWQSLEAAGVRRTARVEFRVTNLSLKQLLVLAAELASGRNVEMSAETDNDVVVVRTQEELELQSVLRVYDVRDLIESDAALHAKRIAAASATIRAAITAGGATPATAPATTQSVPTIHPQHEQYLDSVERLKLIITETVDPASWRDAGGTVGSIREFNGQLVVTQTPVAHDRIAKLLQDLRHK